MGIHESSDEAYRVRNKWLSQTSKVEIEQFDNYSFELSSSIINESVDHLFDALMSQTSDRIFIKDLKGRFVHASKALKEMHKIQDIEGLSDFDFFSKEAAEIAREEELEIMQTGKQTSNRLIKETWHDGSITWASVSKSPLKNDSGVIIGIIGISRDVTQEQQNSNPS